MAKGTKVDDLYISLGLDISELQSDYIRADETVTTNMRRLQRAITNSNLKIKATMSDSDLSGAQKLEAVQKEINRQLDLQRQKLQLAQAEYQNEAKAAGEMAASTQKLQTNMLREQVNYNNLLAQQRSNTLKEQMQPKSGAQGQGLLSSLFNSQLVAPVSSTMASYGSILNPIWEKIQTEQMRNATTMKEKLQATFSAMDSFMTAPFNRMRTEGLSAASALEAIVGVGGRLAGIAAAATAIGMGITKIASSAIAAKNNVYLLAQELHSSIAETAQLSRAAGIVGGNIDTVVSSVMRLDKSVMTAGTSGNAATRMLDAFGVNLKKNDGTLKSYSDQFAALSEGYKRAQAAGMSGEFMTSTLGMRGKDLTTFLSEYEDAMNRASQIKSVNIISPDRAHEMSKTFNQMEAQVKSFSSALSQAFAPAAEVLMPHLINVFRELVDIINNHKPAVIALSRFVGGALSGLIELFNALLHVADKFLYVVDAIPAAIDGIAKAITICIAKLEGWDDSKLRATLDAIDEHYGFKDKKSPDIEPVDKDAQKAAMQKLDMSNNASAITQQAQQQKQAEQEATRAHENASKMFIEASKSMYHAYHTAGENIIYDIQAQEREELAAAKTSEESSAIMAKAAAKRMEVYAEAHRAATKNFAEANLTMNKVMSNEQNPMENYQNVAAQIQEECRQQMEAARTTEEAESIVAKASAKMSESWKSACQQIRELNQSLQDKIFHMTHSDLQNKLYDAKKEYEENMRKGADWQTASKLYWLEVQKAKDEDAARAKSESESKNRSSQSTSTPSMRTYNWGDGSMNTSFQNFTASMEKVSMASQNLSQQNAEIIQLAARQPYRQQQQAQTQHVDYSLHVQVTGLEDVDNAVAQRAAKKIIRIMPDLRSAEVSYAV